MIGLEITKYIHKEHAHVHAYDILEVDSRAFIAYISPEAFFTLSFLLMVIDYRYVTFEHI